MQAIYTSNNYNASDAANQKMVVAVNEQSCGVAVHSATGELLYLGQYDFIQPFKEDETLFFDFVRGQEVMKQKYKDTFVVLDCPKSSLVPAELYNDLYTDNYLRHLYTAEKEEIVKTADIVEDKIKMVFMAPEYLFYPARSKYYEAVIEPNCAGYLRKSIKHYPNKLSVFFDDKHIFIVHADGEKPLFFNSFKCESVDEAAYFILNYYQSFGIDYKALPVVLHGNAHAQLKEILANYSGSSEEAQPVNKNIEVPENFRYAYLIDFTY